jgi:opacity protein-like surface antigen
MEMRWMQEIIRRWSAAAAAGAVILVAFMSSASASASAQPVAHAARTCGISHYYFSLGPTYAEKLSLSGTSCATGVDLIRDYYRCSRREGGIRGYCHSTELGFRCRQGRSSGLDQYIASVRCTKGSEVVNFTYSQNT